ncbi:MAG: S46 family peptidase [Bacteroidales bacterium]|nr:S46 family peptidase [Bacteroidales bacterium]
MKKSILVIFLLTLLAPLARADEGMWLVHFFEQSLIRQMKSNGLKMDPGLIFDQDRVSLSDAIVSMDFGCTGSMVSQNGLLITNHHCAYSDIHAFSTPDHNYLEEGFWARTPGEEKWVSGKSVYFLKKVFDITDRVLSLRDTMPTRRMYATLEREYKELTGYESMCAAMWGGSKYYMYCYEQYKDVRLVGAPPVSIAAYGGEADNWIWPQHKGDFALYRVYTAPDGSPAEYSPGNVPLVPVKTLTINAGGIKEGGFTMVMGYPYSTDRYNSSFGITQIQKTTYPVLVKMTKSRLEIMKKWMEKDPQIRLQYADIYFGVSNVSELREGEVLSLIRHGVAGMKAREEQAMQKWIDANPERQAKWGTLLSDMSVAYKAVNDLTAWREWHKQTIISSQFLTMGRRASGLRGRQNRYHEDSVDCTCKYGKEYYDRMLRFYDSYNPDIEKEWFFRALNEFCDNVPRSFWGEYLEGEFDRFGGDTGALAQFIWNNSLFSRKENFSEFFSCARLIDSVLADPAFRLCESASVQLFNKAEEEILKGVEIHSLDTQYKRALYAFRNDMGQAQYPDANATMRLTFGTTGPLMPQDGITYSWYSTVQGILDKWNPDDYEFQSNPRMLQLLKNPDWGRWADKKDGSMHVNFICDLDITGGNSGSPVLDEKGRLIGLAFDGNKESLGADTFFHKDLNKCVCVDIRYVLWIIEKYAQADYLLDEMNLIF